MIVLTNGNEDPGLKDYGSAVNTSAVDDWEKMSEKGRVARAATHYGDPTDNLLIEVKGEIKELRNRITSLESKVDKLVGSNSEKTANMKSAR
jgi:hypothetical protein